MLGCQDFCGYYEWTFHYLRRRFGEAAIAEYWADAIAADSQQHYLDAARKEGLRGLQKIWTQTGVDEVCDWTVTLDEPGNLLRLDMRECPSKGFLLANDLNADEDYCDHCIGWIGPALHQIGAEVAAHEHNHCGQCWWDIRLLDREQPSSDIPDDIRQDPRWQYGYLDRYLHHVKQSDTQSERNSDWIELVRIRLSSATRLVALDVEAETPAIESGMTLLVSGRRFALGYLPTGVDCCVILAHEPDMLPAIADMFHRFERPPLLLHPYFPQQPKLNLSRHQLPRAIPMLPLLIRGGAYRHQPGLTRPGFYSLSAMLASVLRIPLTLPKGVAASADIERLEAFETHASNDPIDRVSDDDSVAI